MEDSLLEEAAMYLQLPLRANFETAVPTETQIWTYEIGINLDSDITGES